jgi:hypothetical protein
LEEQRRRLQLLNSCAEEEKEEQEQEPKKEEKIQKIRFGEDEVREYSTYETFEETHDASRHGPQVP